jgi:hypothetical protein
MMLSEEVHLTELERAISSSILKANYIGNCESGMVGEYWVLYSPQMGSYCIIAAGSI